MTRRRHRGLTMLELIAVLVILGLLGTFGVYGSRSVINRASRGAAIVRLEAVRSAARSAAATNGNVFPVDLAARVPASGISLTYLAATGSKVSVFRMSASAAAYATLDGSGGCAGVLDNLVTRVTVFVRDATADPANCIGSKIAALDLTTPADQNNPTTVNIDGVAAATTTTSSSPTTAAPTTAPPTTVASVALGSFAKSAGASSADEATDLAVLPDGSAIVVGRFTGTVSFGATSLVSAGGTDVFIGRLSGSGSWLWALRAGGAGADTATAVDVTPLGDTVVGGSFVSSATFGTSTVTSTAESGLFVARVTAQGAWKWVSTSGGMPSATGADSVNGVAILPDGGAAVVGRVGGSPVFGSTTFNSGGGLDLFVAEIDQYGTWQWATNASSSGTADNAHRVAVLSDGSLAVVGQHSGATFGTTTLTRLGPTNDGFVARVSANGSWQWAQNIGTASASTAANGVSIAGDGALVISGTLAGTTLFGTTSLSPAGGTDLFVAKLSAAGAWQWATKGGSSGTDTGFGIVGLPDGSAVVLATLRASGTFGAYSVSSGATDSAVIAKISTAGVWMWATRASTASTDVAQAVRLRVDGSLVVVGSFNGGGAVGATATYGSTQLTSAGAADILAFTVSPTGSPG